ncbi:class IV adenylate cyclase [Salinirubrum litoreum]|uniref:Class IV adenylate cyclase n=1 Tax=Salinirubrum litoreum TaxID=1126234 RepID=A0ABD5RAA8_9EURY|nr:class IV adenylate cyclase [Salinirubrum litoreum]
MYEVELKVRADHAAVRERLAELGATHVERVEQADTYYDAPHRDFAETDEALRVRRETVVSADDAETGSEDATEARVTYKGPLVDDTSKTRREFETGVGDGETMDSVLGGLGFEPAAVVEKTRDRYRLDDYVVTLDSVAGVGEFVEVEREVPEAEVAAAREGAFELLERLGLDPEETIRTSYLGMVLAEED